MNYVRYFETGENTYRSLLESGLFNLSRLRAEGEKALGDEFYCLIGDSNKKIDFINGFIEEIKESLDIEWKTVNEIEKEGGFLDYVVCGGGLEGHKLQKEVNFSDTLVKDGMLCRIPGNRKGMKWSTINAHGWFSYEMKVKPGCKTQIKILMGSNTENLNALITIGDEQHKISEYIGNEIKEFSFSHDEKAGNDFVRIRFDRISKDVPCIFSIKTC